ncbi:MAG: hypothetical protein WBW84_02945 [Acidobacteriaceae bacterium]
MAAAIVLCMTLAVISVIFARKRVHLGSSGSEASLTTAAAPQGRKTPTAGRSPASPVQPVGSLTPSHLISFVPGTPTDAATFVAVPSSKSLVQGSFDIAYEDLRGDGNKEIILQSTSSDFCGSGGCETVVLERNGAQYVTLLDQNLSSPLAVTNDKVNGYDAIASIDDKGNIGVDDKQGTPMCGKQMVYPMQLPPVSQEATGPPTAPVVITTQPKGAADATIMTSAEAFSKYSMADYTSCAAAALTIDTLCIKLMTDPDYDKLARVCTTAKYYAEQFYPAAINSLITSGRSTATERDALLQEQIRIVQNQMATQTPDQRQTEAEQQFGSCIRRHMWLDKYVPAN